jgi:predicted  nucleic acid-binding Zn-ribbon protein
MEEHQLVLTDTRDQLQAARSQGQLLGAQLTQVQQRASEAGEYISRLEAALQAAREDLAEARERAVAAEARIEVLASRPRRSTNKRN